MVVMDITAAVWINDDEPGYEDVLEWLDRIAPPSWKRRQRRGRELSRPRRYRHHRGGEDNARRHLKNLLVHDQVIVPVTEARLDLGPWQQVLDRESTAGAEADGDQGAGEQGGPR